jgi:hypothetical protein
LSPSGDVEQACTLPLHTQREATLIVEAPENTRRTWARGYVYKTLTDLVEAHADDHDRRGMVSGRPRCPFWAWPMRAFWRLFAPWESHAAHTPGDRVA